MSSLMTGACDNNDRTEDIVANGSVVIYISPIAGEKMEEVETAEAIAGAGLEGDRYTTGQGSFDKNGRERGR